MAGNEADGNGHEPIRLEEFPRKHNSDDGIGDVGDRGKTGVLQCEECADKKVTETLNRSAYCIEHKDRGEGACHVMEIDNTGDGIGNESEEESTGNSEEKHEEGAPPKVVPEFSLIALDCCLTQWGKNDLCEGNSDDTDDDGLDVACIGIDGNGSHWEGRSECVENEKANL